MNLDFSRLQFNPFDVPLGTPIFEHYPRLALRRAFSEVPDELFLDDKNRPSLMDVSLLVSFVILLCDRKSPFFEEKNYADRVRSCMGALKIKDDSLVGKVIRESHVWYAAVLTAYLKLLNDADFESWISLTLNAHNLKAFLRSNQDASQDPKGEIAKRKTEIAKMLPEIDASIKGMEGKLFNDKETRELAVEAVTIDSIVGYAERFALQYV